MNNQAPKKILLIAGEESGDMRAAPLVRAIRSGDDDAVDEFSPPQRAAMLALADDFAG